MSKRPTIQASIKWPGSYLIRPPGTNKMIILDREALDELAVMINQLPQEEHYGTATT